MDSLRQPDLRVSRLEQDIHHDVRDLGLQLYEASSPGSLRAPCFAFALLTVGEVMPDGVNIQLQLCSLSITNLPTYIATCNVTPSIASTQASCGDNCRQSRQNDLYNGGA